MIESLRLLILNPVPSVRQQLAPFGLTDAFAQDAQKQMQWLAFLKKNRLQALALHDAIAELATFLLPAVEAASAHTAFPAVGGRVVLGQRLTLVNFSAQARLAPSTHPGSRTRRPVRQSNSLTSKVKAISEVAPHFEQRDKWKFRAYGGTEYGLVTTSFDGQEISAEFPPHA